MGRFWSILKLRKVEKTEGLTPATMKIMLESIGRAREIGGAQMQNEFLGGETIMEHGKTAIGIDFDLPKGEIRLSRKRWPNGASPVVVDIVYEGVVFTVAKAMILVGKEKKLMEAEGISRLSPLDDPEHNDPTQGREKAISQAIRALHTRVMRHRRSYHHYRG